MKKFMFLFVLALTSVFMVGCFGGKDDDKNDDTVDETVILVDEAADYFLTGQFAGWGEATDPLNDGEHLMEAIKLGDPRIASIKAKLTGVQYLYIKSHTVPSNEEELADWTVEYEINGEQVVVNGMNALKIIKTDKNSEIPLFWGPSPESGEFVNLTPETLYVPPYTSDESPAGGWNDDPIILEPGEYYVVYIQYSRTSHAIAVVAK